MSRTLYFPLLVYTQILEIFCCKTPTRLITSPLSASYSKFQYRCNCPIRNNSLQCEHCGHCDVLSKEKGHWPRKHTGDDALEPTMCVKLRHVRSHCMTQWWLVCTNKNFIETTKKFFTFNVSTSIRGLHQKKLVLGLLRFLARQVSVEPRKRSYVWLSW